MELVDDLRLALERLKHRPFLEAAMATAALVAHSDGVVRLSERTRLDDILETLDLLKIYDVHDAVDLFNRYVDRLETDGGAAVEDALNDIARVSENPEEADLLVRVGMAISCADGDFEEGERRILKQICLTLHLPSENYLVAACSR
ncbi:tellurite resistance TerB family protein [Aestuariispira insulae]|nr:TerB family tellurite resistance protein [Aestuariispira insulae]